MPSYMPSQVDHNLYQTQLPQSRMMEVFSILESKQNMYNAGVETAKNTVKSMSTLDQNVSSQYVKGMVNDFNGKTDQILQSYQNLDFSIQGNVDAVSNMYTPLLDNQDFISDYADTQRLNSEIQYANSLKYSKKAEDRALYADTNLEFFYKKKQILNDATNSTELKSAREEIAGLGYTPYYDPKSDLKEFFGKDVLSVEMDVFMKGEDGNPSGYIIHYKNGEIAHKAFSDLFGSAISDKGKKQLYMEGYVSASNYADNFGKDKLIEWVSTTAVKNLETEIKRTEEDISNIDINISKLTDSDAGKQRKLELSQDKENAVNRGRYYNKQLDNIKNSFEKDNFEEQYKLSLDISADEYSVSWVNNLANSFADATREDPIIKKDEVFFEKQNLDLAFLKYQTELAKAAGDKTSATKKGDTNNDGIIDDPVLAFEGVAGDIESFLSNNETMTYADYADSIREDGKQLLLEQTKVLSDYFNIPLGGQVKDLDGLFKMIDDSEKANQSFKEAASENAEIENVRKLFAQGIKDDPRLKEVFGSEEELNKLSLGNIRDKFVNVFKKDLASFKSMDGDMNMDSDKLELLSKYNTIQEIRDIKQPSYQKAKKHLQSNRDKYTEVDWAGIGNLLETNTVSTMSAVLHKKITPNNSLKGFIDEETSLLNLEDSYKILDTYIDFERSIKNLPEDKRTEAYNSFLNDRGITDDPNIRNSIIHHSAMRNSLMTESKEDLKKAEANYTNGIKEELKIVGDQFNKDLVGAFSIQYNNTLANGDEKATTNASAYFNQYIRLNKVAQTSKEHNATGVLNNDPNTPAVPRIKSDWIDNYSKEEFAEAIKIISGGISGDEVQSVQTTPDGTVKITFDKNAMNTALTNSKDTPAHKIYSDLKNYGLVLTDVTPNDPNNSLIVNQYAKALSIDNTKKLNFFPETKNYYYRVGSNTNGTYYVESNYLAPELSSNGAYVSDENGQIKFKASPEKKSITLPELNQISKHKNLTQNKYIEFSKLNKKANSDVGRAAIAKYIKEKKIEPNSNGEILISPSEVVSLLSNIKI